MPLVTAGRPSDSTSRRAASSAPSAQTSVPEQQAVRLREQVTDLRERLGVRLDPAAPGDDRPLDRGLVEELVHRHVEEGGPAVGGAGDGEGLVDREAVPATSCTVQASFVTGPSTCGWSSSWRLPPPAVGGGAAADHDQGAAELGLGDGADPVGHAGTGGEHGQAGNPGELAERLGGGEHGGLLVPHVEQPRDGSAFTAPSYMGIRARRTG